MKFCDRHGIKIHQRTVPTLSLLLHCFLLKSRMKKKMFSWNVLFIKNFLCVGVKHQTFIKFTFRIFRFSRISFILLMFISSTYGEFGFFFAFWVSSFERRKTCHQIFSLLDSISLNIEIHRYDGIVWIKNIDPVNSEVIQTAQQFFLLSSHTFQMTTNENKKCFRSGSQLPQIMKKL